MDTNKRIHDYEDFALDMVDIKAAELVGKAGYTADDFDDIKQDMLLDLVVRLEKYDPSRSNFKLFVTCVIDRKAQNLIRFRESDKRDYRREDCWLNDKVATEGSAEPVERLTTYDQDDQDIRSGKHRRTADDRMQLCLDVAAVLASLPPELCQVAEMLQTQNVSQVAGESNIPRRTLRRSHMARLHEAFTANGLAFHVS